MLFKCFICFFFDLQLFLICFSNALARGEFVKLACFIILLWSENEIYSPGRQSYLSIFPDDNGDIFAASLLISYGSFLSLIISSIARVSFYILFKRFSLKRKDISNAKVASITKKVYGFALHFLWKFIKSWKSICLDSICWSSRLFEIS